MERGGSSAWDAWFPLLLIPLMVLFACASGGHVSSNDGSHLALVRALSREGSFRIDRFRATTNNVDYAAHGGHFFTDRPPGTAFLAAPVVWAAARVGILAPATDEAGVAEDYAFAVLVPNMLGALAAFLLFRALRLFGCGGSTAAVVALAFAIGSLNLRYATALFSHGTSATVLLGAFLLTASWVRREGGSHGALLAAGVVSGFVVVTDYSLVLTLPALVLWVLAAEAGGRGGQPGGFGAALRAAAIFGLGAFLGVLPLLVYNAACFGSPFRYSYQFQGNFDWSRNVQGTFTGSFWVGLSGLLVAEKYHSLFRNMPWGIFALPGFVLALRNPNMRGAALAGAGVFIPVLLLLAKHKTFWGGWTGDYRYLFSVVFLVALAAGVAVQALADLYRRGGRGRVFAAAGLILFVELVLIAVVYNVAIIPVFCTRSLATLPPVGTFGSLWEFLLNRLPVYFPSGRHLPVYAAGATLLVMAGVGARALLEKGRDLKDGPAGGH